MKDNRPVIDPRDYTEEEKILWSYPKDTPEDVLARERGFESAEHELRLLAEEMLGEQVKRRVVYGNRNRA